MIWNRLDYRYTFTHDKSIMLLTSFQNLRALLEIVGLVGFQLCSYMKLPIQSSAIDSRIPGSVFAFASFFQQNKYDVEFSQEREC